MTLRLGYAASSLIFIAFLVATAAAQIRAKKIPSLPLLGGHGRGRARGNSNARTIAARHHQA